MSIPVMPVGLMYHVYRKVFPAVHRELDFWREKAQAIPNPELRRQALASIESKTFHCEGGAIMSLTAMEKYQSAIRFIVAYQTISDYLDNLCDRSTSLDPDDFAALHESMEDALSISGDFRDYYREREDRDDGGYLQALVTTCREELQALEHYEVISGYLFELCRYYCDLQIHKHVEHSERVPRLKSWFDMHKENIPDMQWYEFSACTGSTLGIFCLVSYAMRTDFKPEFAESIWSGYFPYIQGLHILLDYFIDQDEDRLGGDLNFCFYYDSEEALFERLKHFLVNADRHTSKLPHQRFHRLINRGLLGVYLSDEKVQQHRNIKKLAKEMIKSGGPVSYFFYLNGRAYRSFQKWVPASLVKSLSK
ncbi:tetraprenyl-beta-curcumene synthase family protein [Mesobacillus foraminis]|uniref:tetraprenyl-beta-curcumene synthase family protein n=1 Tax=Mesobacillus foraminis TaxID=279826 RepID=UPI001BE7771F|nr:tetraprenyl-beta-curcumene synthase family protein [Mesobacillus foraminis]MBT2754377.1 tetraprenyl-beta-curcumene synthase family protein [Mesobacillus foraminis]